MGEEKLEIKIETDPKTGFIKNIALPRDLPVEERVTLLIPFIDSLRAAILRLDADTRKYSRTLKILTIVLIILPVCLVVLGIIQIVR